MTHRLVVVGASLAGLRAVEAARKSGFDGQITLVGSEEHLPYDRPPLSKAYLDDAEPPTVEFRDEVTLRGELAVELELGIAATGLDTDSRVIALADGRELTYDALVIATGATARRLPGTDSLVGVHALRTLDDAAQIRAALNAGARTVVIGAGFIGSEIASGARKRGLPVTVIEALPTPLIRAVGEEMGSRLARLHVENGTELRCGAGVERLEGNGRVELVVLSDGTKIRADLVVVGIGAVPATDWLRGSGLRIDNGIVCDENLWTGTPGVYAAGDVANWHNPLFGRRMRLEHWTSAAQQGASAARNALNPDAAKPYSTVPYFWSDWYGSRIQFVGSPDADEIVTIEDRGDRLTALYRAGDRLSGALTLNGQADIMKFSGLITKRTEWGDAVRFAESRCSARATA
ncbi:NAD(P)/FAD-dependent oxidoreductase [Smaragdicoccus niigatensis]|uniref:NAD(P)/FAD-dependent oxidoreductase n=1 Tax=Smaragdicoccus niigatensis TaxID=359359 RepID=UPI00036A09C3|nr:FAD-dependent oxidoreductase [Smaragdicoccus niigatensis]